MPALYPASMRLRDRAALAKLFYLFSRGEEPQAVRRRMGEDLRGELSVQA